MHTEKPTIGYAGADLTAERIEHRSLNMRAMVIATVIFIVFSVLMFIGLYIMFRVADEALAPAGPKMTEMAEGPARLPARDIPRLQGVPTLSQNVPQIDLAAFRIEQEQDYNATGPTTRPGFMKMPVDSAMTVLIEQHAGAAHQAAPTTAPTTAPSKPASPEAAPVKAAPAH